MPAAVETADVRRGSQTANTAEPAAAPPPALGSPQSPGAAEVWEKVAAEEESRSPREEEKVAAEGAREDAASPGLEAFLAGRAPLFTSPDSNGAVNVAIPQGGSGTACPSPLNALKDTYDMLTAANSPTATSQGAVAVLTADPGTTELEAEKAELEQVMPTFPVTPLGGRSEDC